MVFPWIFEDYKYLQPFKEVSNLLAKKKDWPILYNIEKLSKNQVPCAAIIYIDDMVIFFLINYFYYYY